MRLGDSEGTEKNTAAVKPDGRIDNNFIACIGTLEIRKNHTLLYYAYKLAAQQNIKLPQLVIVGSRGWLTGDLQYLIEHDPYIKNDIIILDNIDDCGLDWIYKNCLYTIYPSMYEGWGLPVAESLARGKMCIASNSSSLPEIAGELIDYFSPYSVNDCLLLMQKYLQEKNINKKNMEIEQSYKATTWKSTFDQVEKAITSI